MRALSFPQSFKIEWIKIMLSEIHDGHLWLENGLVKINKTIIHRVIGYPTLGCPKRMHCDAKGTIETKINIVWNKRGMSIDTIKDPLIEFLVRVISHKFYKSSRLNSMPYIVVDLGYKIMRKDCSYDLVKL